ncbi:MAG: DUF4339 domain-containing protein [Verrucomicrobiota bacterium]|nr:DUF4339 domain-containing protein [Verrucomicrobiota bacterium]
MTTDESAAAEASEQTAYIARDGVELGIFWRDEIGRRAREGEFRPTDFYWHDGMANWVRLDELLGPEPWQTPPAAPTLKSRLILAGAIAGGFLFAVLVAIIVINSGSGNSAPRVAKISATRDAAQEEALKQKAANELRAKIERLPAQPGPPLFIFFYDVAVNMRPSLSPGAIWDATVRGSENVVDEKNGQTLRRTEFVLITDYRDGEWTFQHYQASTRNLVEAGQTEEEADPRTMTPPTLVTLLGLKIEPPESFR